MRSILSLEINGVPLAKKRPRFRQRNGKVQTYNPQQDEDNGIKLLLKSKYRGYPIASPIRVTLDFFFTQPKYVKRQFHSVKPDLDNLVKSILDNGNGILWTDDKIIVEIIAKKSYGDKNKTKIKVEQAENTDD